MSYDIDIRFDGVACPACGHVPEAPELPNPTYNLTAIFDLALTDEPYPNPEVGEAAAVLFRAPTDRPRGLRVLSGRRVRETVPQITTALERLRDPSREAAFRALEPSNGWGTLPDAIAALQRLLVAAENVPDGTWDIR